MHDPDSLEIFLAAPPGLEDMLAAEAREKGFDVLATLPGGVTCRGGWAEVWRANLELRGAGRVLARIGRFMAFHLAQLDKRARKFDWGAVLRPDVPLRVEVTCRKSKIYHAGAATQRIETALREEFGATLSPEAEIVLKVRIDDNNVLISVDTSGAPLHRRGHKEAVGKAPMRENLAALFLRRCGFDGCETVVDPMCGSGTFVIEAAEIAAGLQPGRSRRFAFEQLAPFDADAWAAMRAPRLPHERGVRFYGHDRDTGAIRSSQANAERAGVAGLTCFTAQPISALTPPEGPREGPNGGCGGLVIVNPPYGGRIGNKNLLYALYGTLGQVLSARFAGWRVGLVTSEPGLAKATGLRFTDRDPPVAFGGLKVGLYRTGRL
ncbi:THUMP domain-containing class I SAM-dependent RNA methyltransferase [Brevirhabdus sp.]|uniref:THUMP domain-containing class I SAM-dependent RNA methyltransferase n=1 Tax=Brevirhabdus sp. TaxID=2004514 RepID=UPI0040581AAE